MEIKYEKYPLKELYVILHNIDKEKYPDLVIEIKKQIQLKTLDQNSNQEIKAQENLKQVTRWHRFRFFRMLIAVSLPFVLLFSFLARFISTSFGYLMFACVFIFCFSVLYTTFWKCPQCGKSFCTGMIWIFGSNIPFRNTCIHCGYRVIQKD